MKSLVGRTLYSQVSPDVTCKILAVSPGNKRVYFCEITEFGDTNYQILSEMDVQKYYSKENNQDLLYFYAALTKSDRIIIQEIRGAEAAGFLKAVPDGHPGMITTLHAATPHQELTDLIFARLKEEKINSRMSGTGMTALCRNLDEYGEDDKNVLFIEDTREIDRGEVVEKCD